jgi:hypothetical protein
VSCVALLLVVVHLPLKMTFDKGWELLEFDQRRFLFIRRVFNGGSVLLLNRLWRALLSFVAVAGYVAHYATVTASAGKLGLTGSKVIVLSFSLSPFLSAFVIRSCVLALPGWSFTFALAFARAALPSSFHIVVELDFAELFTFGGGMIPIWGQTTFCCLGLRYSGNASCQFGARQFANVGIGRSKCG